MKYRNSFFYQALSLLTAVAIFHLSLTSSGYARSGMNGRGGSEGSQKRSGGRTGSGDFGLIEENLEFFTTTLSQAVLALPEEELRARLEQAPTQPGFDEIFQSVNTADLAQLIRNTRPYFGEDDYVGIAPDGECASLPIVETPVADHTRHFSWGCDAESGLYLAVLPRWRDRSAYGEVPALLVPLKNRRFVYLSLLQEAAHTWGYPNSQARPFAESLYAALENELMQAALTSPESSAIVVDRQLRVFYPVNDDLTGAHYSQHFYALEMPRNHQEGDPTDGLTFPLLRCEMRPLTGQGLELTSSAAFTTYFRCESGAEPVLPTDFDAWKTSEAELLYSLRDRLQASQQAFARLLEKYTISGAELQEMQAELERIQRELPILTADILALKEERGYIRTFVGKNSLYLGVFALVLTSISFTVWLMSAMENRENLTTKDITFSRKIRKYSMRLSLVSFFLGIGALWESDLQSAHDAKLAELRAKAESESSALKELLVQTEELDAELSALAAVLNSEIRTGVRLDTGSQIQAVIQSSLDRTVESLEWAVTSSTPAVEVVPVPERIWRKYESFFGARFARP